MTVKDLTDKTAEMLLKGGVENALFESKCIVMKASSMNSTELILNMNKDVPVEVTEYAKEMADNRLSGQPLQYCLGEWDFFGETFKVGKGVLIPRPETEELTEYVINNIKNMKGPKVVDLCAGSGAIGLTIKKNVPESRVTLVEKSGDAFKFLKENAFDICKNQQVVLINDDIYNTDNLMKIIDRPDVIVSNPPYIKREDLTLLQKEVQKEPVMALDGGEDGCDFYRLICNKWAKYLNGGGFVALECGEDQADYISELFDKNIFETKIIKDFNCVNRFVIGRKISK